MPGEFDSAMSCMNREYACTHGYYFLAASRPDFMMAKPIEKSPGCEPRPGTAWSTFPCA